MSVADTKSIIDILTSGNLANERIAELAKAFIQYDESLGWTNAQIAERFLADLRIICKARIQGGAEQLARKENQTVITAAGNAAVSDFS